MNRGSAKALSYNSDLTLSQAFQPMAAQLSKKAMLPLAKIRATASCRSSKPGPCWWLILKPCRCNSFGDEALLNEVSSKELQRLLYITGYRGSTLSNGCHYAWDTGHSGMTRIFSRLERLHPCHVCVLWRSSTESPEVEDGRVLWNKCLAQRRSSSCL